MPYARQAVALLFTISSIAGAVSAAEAVPPRSVRCSLASVAACNSDGICIGDPVTSRFEITFDFAGNRFRSAWGYGRITQAWDQRDGTHAIIVSAPPASAEIVFSADYSSASYRVGQSVRSFACTSRQSR